MLILNTTPKNCRNIFFFLVIILSTPRANAHNGALAYAYPMSTIKVDGDLSDWAQVKKRYPIKVHLSDQKPESENDLSAYYKIGYQPITHTLYIAVEVTDDDYFRDTSKKVAWNTQDGLELDLDINHSASGSGVASYLFSKDFKSLYNSKWDPVAKLASWDKTEAAIKRTGNKTIYEWKFIIDGQLHSGKTIGLDFQVFDKDAKGPFSWSAWGKEGFKYRNPNSLGDVILMKGPEKLGSISGHISWKNGNKETLPNRVYIKSTTAKNLWVAAEIDTMGWYHATLPVGNYEVTVKEGFQVRDKKIFSIVGDKPFFVKINAGLKTEVPVYTVNSSEAPDLLPAEGILHNFDVQKSKVLDDFIRTYQNYYQVPGVSLALIKDGKVVYHQSYGVKNIITQDKVEEHTLFEAASITKPVFAYAVQSLMEKGLIDLDKPLYEYLPNKDIEQDERYKKITARHVLTHRTGFPNWRYMNNDGKLDIKFEPGTKYGYSGEGFEYLKKVVEKVTGKKVEQVLEEEVINPLGLYHFYFSKNDTLQKLVATGHYDNLPSNDGLPEEPGMAYSLHTEAVAFTRFMLALMNQQGLKPETYEHMLKVHSEFNTEEGKEKPKYHEYMGISLAVRETPYGLAYGHGGNNGDFRCQFEIYKDLKMGYVMFTNGSGASPLLDVLPQLLVEGKK